MAGTALARNKTASKHDQNLLKVSRPKFDMESSEAKSNKSEQKSKSNQGSKHGSERANSVNAAPKKKKAVV